MCMWGEKTQLFASLRENMLCRLFSLLMFGFETLFNAHLKLHDCAHHSIYHCICASPSTCVYYTLHTLQDYGTWTAEFNTWAYISNINTSLIYQILFEFIRRFIFSFLFCYQSSTWQYFILETAMHFHILNLHLLKNFLA